MIVDTKRRRDPLGGLVHPSLRCMLVGDAFLGAKTLKTERPTERTDSTYYINAKMLLITVGTGRRAGISDLGLFLPNLYICNTQGVSRVIFSGGGEGHVKK